MSEELFDLVFKGELSPGFDAAQVKKNLQQLFRINEQQVESLFSGKPITLKKQLDADTANKYRVAMKKAGARVNVVQSENVPAKPADSVTAKKAATTPPSAPPTHQERATGDQYETALGAQADKPKQARQPINAPDYKVAAVGSNMIEEGEKEHKQAVDVSITHLDVAPMEGNLVGEDELMSLPILEIDVPDFDVAPVGADVLKPQERKKQEAVDVDTSSLSVDAAGVNLAPAKKPSPPPPNVDHIKLED